MSSQGGWKESFRTNINDILLSGVGTLPKEDADKVIARSLEGRRITFPKTAYIFHRAQWELLLNAEPAPLLTELTDANPGIRLYRLKFDKKLPLRDSFWRIVRMAQPGMAPD